MRSFHPAFWSRVLLAAALFAGPSLDSGDASGTEVDAAAGRAKVAADSLPPPGRQLDEMIAGLRKRVARDPGDPAAQAALGVALQRTGRLEDRIDAVTHLEHALHEGGCTRDQGDARFCADCWLALGITRVREGLDDYAADALRKALALDSTRARAHLELGLVHLRAWRNGGRRNSPRLDGAREELSRAFDLDPASARAALRLIIVAKARHEAAMVAEVAKRLAEAAPDRPETWLVEGLAQFELGRVDPADRAFRAATAGLDSVDGPLAAAMGDTRLLRMPGEEKAYAHAGTGPRDPSGRPERDRMFWTSHDPTPTTPVNERLLEHYCRVVIADALCEIPGSARRGFDTGQGELFIRYGAPDTELREGGNVNPMPLQGSGSVGTYVATGPDVRPIESEDNPAPGSPTPIALRSDDLPGYAAPTLTAVYRFPDTTVSIRLEDPYLSGNYRPPRAPGVGGASAPRPLEAVLPAHTRWQHPGLEFPLAVHLYRFLDSGRTIVAAFIALPSWAVEPRQPGPAGRVLVVERRLVLFDGAWKEAARGTGAGQYRLAEDEVGRAGYFSDEIEAELHGAAAHAAVEVESEDGMAHGAWRSDGEIAPLARHGLAVSDIVCATIVGGGPTSASLVRNDIAIGPRPNHCFAPGDAVHIYYEVYGLAPGDSGTSRFVSHYAVTLVPESRGVLSRIGRAIGIGRSHAIRNLAYAFERGGASGVQSEYLAIDTAGMQAGDYRLLVRIEDQVSGRTAEREAEFHLVGVSAP